MSASGPSPADHHARADAALRAVLDGAAGAAAWDAPSPCEGWTARDVVRHLIETQTSFLVERAGLTVEPAADELIAATLAEDPAAAWSHHVERISPLIADRALMATAFDGYFGPTTVGDTFEQFYVFDMVVHRWDLARALGVPASLTDDELDMVETSAAGWGPALHMDGVCKQLDDPGPDADRATRVLALLGRRAD